MIPGIVLLYGSHIFIDECKLSRHQACSFAASNKGQYVADVFKEVIKGREQDFEYHRHVTKRIKGDNISSPFEEQSVNGL